MDPLRELVEISSHTADRAGVTAVAERLGTRLGALCPSLAIERRPSERFGDHLIASTAAAGPRVLLVGHHDTVFPRASFAGFREDGALAGRRGHVSGAWLQGTNTSG